MAWYRYNDAWTGSDRRWDSYKNHRDWKWVEFTHCHWLVLLYRNSDFLYKRESYFIAEVVIMTPLSTHKEPDVIVLGSSDCRQLWSLGIILKRTVLRFKLWKSFLFNKPITNHAMGRRGEVGWEPKESVANSLWNSNGSIHVSAWQLISTWSIYTP